MTALRTFVPRVRTRTVATEVLAEEARRAYAKLSALIKMPKEFLPVTDERE